jgi:hypothetical protein
MSILRHARIAALAALAMFAGACGDSSTGPADIQPADLSQVLAELQPSSIAPLADQLSAVPLTAVGAPTPSTCTFDGASKSFVCPNVSVTGVTVSRSFTLLDASGAAQSAFDRTTTAAVRMKTTFAGTVTSGASTVVVDQQQDLTLSGLLTGIHTLNGTVLAKLNGTLGTGTGTIPVATTILTTINSLVLPRGDAKWPQSGSIAATITDASFAVPMVSTFTIAFNGTSTATVTVTAVGFSGTFTIDLANPGPIRG